MTPRKLLSSLLLATAALASTPALGAKGFFSRYNLGVTYEVSTSYARIDYDAPRQGEAPEDCEAVEAEEPVMHCTAYLGPDEDDAPIPSLFLAEPFVRQGLLYFDFGLTFATVTYKGGIVSKPSAPRPSAPTGGKRRPPEDIQPLDHAYLELYGINWQTYVRVGLTPRYLPDVFLTGGIGIQTIVGRVRVLEEEATRGVVQPSAFGEVEAVVVRVGTGALSAFVAQDQSILGRSGTPLIDDGPSGTEITDIRLGLAAASSGVRLLFPF